MLEEFAVVNSPYNLMLQGKNVWVSMITFCQFVDLHFFYFIFLYFFSYLKAVGGGGVGWGGGKGLAIYRISSALISRSST